MAHSASSRRYTFRFTGPLLIGPALAAALLLNACDSESSKTDKKITEQLNQAMDQMTGSAADRQAANQQLDSAAKETTASLPTQLNAKALLADSELQTAQGLVVQIQSNDALIDRLARETGLLGEEIQTNNEMVVGLSKRDPGTVQAAVAANVSQVKGSDDKPDWYKSDATTLASLSADDKSIASLQADLSKLQDTIKAESDQRNQLLDQADKLSQQSLHEKQQKSVDLYVEGSDARKQAADLTVKLDLDNATLTRTQADLALQQSQHDSLTSALKGLDDKSAFINDEWKNTQQQMDALNAASKSILGEDPVTPPARDTKGDLKTQPTIGSKASAIAELAKANHDLRANAETHFNSAINFYKDAVSLADSIKRDIGLKQSKANDQKPEQLAWTEELNALDSATYRFLQADAQLQKAEFSAGSAAEAKSRLDLATQVKAVLQPAQLNAPPTMDDSSDSIATQLKDAQTSARDSFKDSTDALSGIFDGTGSQDVRNAAKVHEIFGQYAWSLLETSAGDQPAATTHLSAARSAVDAATAAGAALPPLPAALIVPAAAPAGAVPGTTTPGAFGRPRG